VVPQTIRFTRLKEMVMTELQPLQENAHGRWVEQGNGAPVILIHGIPTSPRLWRHVIPLVQGRSLAWEMPGYGTSIPQGANKDLSLSTQAGYLLDWLDSLALEVKPVLVGHDLGGGVAQIAAVRQPDAFAGLMLTNSVAYDSWPIPSVKIMQRLAPVLARLPASLIYPTMVQLLHRGHDNRQRALESIGEHWAPYVTHGAARALMRQVLPLTASDTKEISGQLHTLGLPARVVWGAADGFQKIRFGERLAAELGCAIIRIPEGKHFTPEDHPETVAAAINSLLSESQDR
jgi:pimeloyl-ACP methyl ester carboxylesterase